MRIAVWHNLPSGGGRRAMIDHVVGLVERGHDVVVFSPDSGDDGHPRWPEHLSRVAVPLTRTWETRSWSALPPAPVTYTRMRAMDRHLAAVAAAINDGGFDVLYTGACAWFRVPRLASLVRIRSALYLGEPYRWLYEAMPELPWLRRSTAAPHFGAPLSHVGWLGALRRQARREVDSARAFDRLLVNSLFSRESVLRAYGLESHVCRLGVDVARFRIGAWPRTDVVLGVGAIVPEKRVTAAVRAVASSRRSLSLTWVGNVADPRYAEEVRQLADHLGVDLRLEIDVGEERLGSLFATAAAVVYAPRLEPFGYVPLEAAASATPVVGVAEGGVRETVVPGVTGLLVDDERALGGELARLVDDRDGAERLGRAGRRYVEDHWQQSAAIDRIEGHLTDLAEMPPR